MRLQILLHFLQLYKFNYSLGNQPMETIQKLSYFLPILKHQSREHYQYSATKRMFSMKFQSQSSKDPNCCTTSTGSRCLSPRAAQSTRSRTPMRTSLPGKNLLEQWNTLCSTCSLFIISTSGGFLYSWSTICTSIGNTKKEEKLHLKKYWQIFYL